MAGHVASVILAAGHSTRMGDANKLLAPIAGKTMIRHVADNVLAANTGPIYVVTGHDADHVRAALGDLPLDCVHNADHDRGLSSSIKCGISRLPKDVAGAMIVLGDMPLVRADTLRALAGGLGDRHDAVVPVMDGKWGNPVVWHRRMFPHLLALEGDRGARHLLRQQQAGLNMLDMDDPGIFIDADTRQALTHIRTVLDSHRS